jgi:hypothetical protein
VKKNKRKKKVKGNQHFEGCESQIFKSRFRSTIKRSWSETWMDCRKL